MQLSRSKTFLTTMPGAARIHRRTLLDYTNGERYEASSVLPEAESATLRALHRAHLAKYHLTDIQLPFFQWLARTRGEAATQWDTYDFTEYISAQNTEYQHGSNDPLR